ncbi:MAG: hypothetical protein BWY59_02156 [Verrucomicrobia bacterium ADurb.Bin345]|nr:MAG: hypothetical protein BWY59_02156 [Verrucomicrobia bacterium ADurb.Bin345]
MNHDILQTSRSADWTAEIAVKCCACRRVLENGNWLEDPGALPGFLVYSHTYCPTCLKDVHESLDALGVCAAGTNCLP